MSGQAPTGPSAAAAPALSGASGVAMFGKILIANRGEIACRIIRTARRLGIRTAAVYSEADAACLHVEMADEAYPIGPAPARASYLDIAAILDAARRAGVPAIHPGYGFLAENATFAERCAAAGFVFIGPPPAAIRAMGDKSAARALMARAGVPIVPGYHGEDKDPTVLLAEARRIGFPVLIKPAAGGGGKGMRVVTDAADFAAELAGARREAESAFGDGRVVVERYLARPRHVEVQIFADGHGSCVSLFDRDCSIQRRHQKIIEEAPAPNVPPETRRRMGAAAVAAARAAGHVGAGTVEFLLDAVETGGDGSFFFMEMNTRLQVEHPVTERVTGLDLVEWQLRVAAGAPLPLQQNEIKLEGHAIEARLYAEDPARGFLPQAGRIEHLRLPAEGPHVRVDTGVRAGDLISIHYDPMIAKVVVSDVDRTAAVHRLREALAGTEIVGVTTNLALLAAIAGAPAFLAADRDTSFIARHQAELLPASAPAPDRVVLLAALGVLLERARATRAAAAASGDPHSPWWQSDSWRLNGVGRDRLVFRDGEALRPIELVYRPQGYRLCPPEGEVAASGALEADGTLSAFLDGVRLHATFVRRGPEVALFVDGAGHSLRLVEPLAAAADLGVAPGHLAAPMPGKVTAVLVTPGAAVCKGQALVVLEAMKMEHTITAPADGTVEGVRFAVGDQVEDGAELIDFAAAPA